MIVSARGAQIVKSDLTKYFKASSSLLFENNMPIIYCHWRSSSCFTSFLNFWCFTWLSPAKAVDGILEWYRQHGVSIQPNKVHFFGDRTENIGPFSSKGYNAREISCKERDLSLYQNGMVGLCGAAFEEIVDTPGVAECSQQRRLMLV